MAGLAWSAPVSWVALSMRGTRAVQRADTPNATLVGVLCACRRHQRCHCKETESSVRLRFLAALGQAAACPYLVTWGAGRKAQWLVEN